MAVLSGYLRPRLRPLTSAVTEGGGGLGPEIVVNGTFGDGLTGWTTANTAPATVAVSGGRAVWDTSGGGTGRLRQVISTIPGQKYAFTCEFPAGMSSAIGTAAGLSDVLAFSGLTNQTFIATTALSHLSFVSATNAVYVDNVSIRAMTGIKSIRTIRTEGDSYMGGAGGVSLPTTLQTTASRAVVNTGVGSSDMAGVRTRVLAATGSYLLPFITVFWDGSHNGYVSNPQYLGELQDAITALGHGRFIVIPPAVPYGATVTVPEAIAAGMAAQWPNNYLDWRSYIPNTAGVINLDRMLNYPTDTVHLNQTAMNEMAAGITAFIAAKGW